MDCRACKNRSRQLIKHEDEYDRLEMLYDEIFELLDGVARGIIEPDDIHVREALKQHELIRYGTHPEEFEDFGYSENVR